MGIFGALTTAVTGLRAQSFALENISGNIANSQTTAFKRVDTSFQDLIPDNPPSKQLSGLRIGDDTSRFEPESSMLPPPDSAIIPPIVKPAGLIRLRR